MNIIAQYIILSSRIVELTQNEPVDNQNSNFNLDVSTWFASLAGDVDAEILFTCS